MTPEFNLLTKLKSYKTNYTEEKTFVAETINFLENGKDQFVRTNLEKHIVAGAYLFNEELSMVLLTHHKAFGLWLHLGGHSDNDSNSLNVALRETMEESGITNINTLGGEIFDVDIHTVPSRPEKNEPEHKHIDIKFIFTTQEKNFVVSSESLSLKWVPINEYINFLISGSTSSGKRLAEKLKLYVENNKPKFAK